MRRSWFTLVLLFACSEGSGELGAPCDAPEDCDETLICDVHDGRGSCQKDHDHLPEALACDRHHPLWAETETDGTEGDTEDSCGDTDAEDGAAEAEAGEGG